MQHEPDFDVGAAVKAAMEEAIRERGSVNLVLAGRSGVGKSTLVNVVFGKELAAVGQGRPVTQTVHEYTHSDFPLTIFDTRGLEIGSYKETRDALMSLVAARGRETDPTRHLHIAWLCIDEDSRRVQVAETDVAEHLARVMPVVVVITKARSDRGFRDEVRRLIPSARAVVSVRALREEDDDGHVREPAGLVDLVRTTMELVPEGQRQAFAAAQRVDLETKEQEARKIVGKATVAAGIIGASPIPFSDAALLVPVQIAMLAKVSLAFGVPISDAFMATLLSGGVTAVGATLSGRLIATGLLSLFPGVGMVVGRIITAATAASVTRMFGEAYVHTLRTLLARRPGQLPSQQEISETFQQNLHTEARLAA